MAHPAHPAFVHFPIACWTISTFGDIASFWLGTPAWQFSGILLVIGTVTAIAAMITGLLELRRISHAESVTRTVDTHIQLMLSAWVLYAMSLLLRISEQRLGAPGVIETGLSCFGLLIMIAGGWHGGKLVYTHGAGVGGKNEK
ncbi:MAG TPA: DUF2231 domain-containing protein [Methylophilaceae bacterium]|nr:DUF2231 domain-containing protein [Methylophilaceae bacterium]